MTYKRFQLYQTNDGSAIDSVLGETVSITTKSGVEKESTITRTHINTDIGNGLLELKPSSIKKSQKKKSPSKEKQAKKEKKVKVKEEIQKDALNDLLKDDSESESESENESDDE